MLARILTFLDEIAIDYSFEELSTDTILPGVSMKDGILIIYRDKLLFIGDVLHEAGHLACMPPDIRKTMCGKLEDNDMHHGGEMMAMAWSFAVANHLSIPASIVFHENGYNGDAENLIKQFEWGNGVGVPLLQWNSMCYDQNGAILNQSQPFPHMLKWTCEINNYG
jgi:hypothetical protein